MAVGSRADELVGTSFPALFDPPLSAEGWRLLLDHVDSDRHHRVRVALRARHGHTVATAPTAATEPAAI